MRLAVASLLIVCSCNPPPPRASEPVRCPDARPEPSSPTALDASVVPPTIPSAVQSEERWTSPTVIEKLNESCDYDFRIRPKDDDRDSRTPSTLDCEYGLYGKSTLVDPCFRARKDFCHVRCERTCDSCATRCVRTCERCKRACAEDDECKRGCAVTCAHCRDECLVAKDRCASTTCAKQFRQCQRATQAQWIASGCQKGCVAYQQCIEPCPDGVDPLSLCAKSCQQKHLLRCPPELRKACLFNGPKLYDALTD